MQRKFIIVTGGVLSGIGKGIAVASIGKLFSNDFNILPIKCDGYLNVDPGTMNPIEHGEVFVLNDGGEVDMDFGHYERFIGKDCKSEWNLTMGKVFEGIRQRERKGEFLGKTVQYIPHVTNYIKEKIYSISEKENSDITIVEIGGTVGDIENELFLRAVQEMKREVGRENIIYVHITYVPIPYGVDEQKSKPTQQSIEKLLRLRINPDIIIARCGNYITKPIKEKISLFCNVKEEDVITGIDTDNIYKIPLIFDEQSLTRSICEKLRIYARPNLEKLKELIYNMENSEREVNIAICGKYSDLNDSYASIYESLKHCSANLKTKINIKLIETTGLENKNLNEVFSGINGIIVPGGFGDRGIEGKISVANYSRVNNIPFLGLCLGLQIAIIEFARNICNMKDSNSIEFSDNCTPVIALMNEQENVINKGGTMRLGAYTAKLKENTLVRNIYQAPTVSERHRHRYEVNTKYHNLLMENGMVLSGLSEDEKLVEFIELPNHKFFVATQSHPELKSKLEKPAPLFYSFISSCIK